MKSLLLIMMFVSSSAFARELHGELQGPARVAKDCLTEVYSANTRFEVINRAQAKYIVAEQAGFKVEDLLQDYSEKYVSLPSPQTQQIYDATKACIELGFPLVQLREEFALAEVAGFSGKMVVLGEFIRLVSLLTIERVQASYALENALDIALAKLARDPEIRKDANLSIENPLFLPVIEQTQELLEPVVDRATILGVIKRDENYADIYGWMIKKR